MPPSTCQFLPLQRQACGPVCPPQFEHSTSFFHFPDCYQPVLYLPIYVGLHGVISLIAFVSLMRLLSTLTNQPDVYRLCQYTILYCVLEFARNLTLYLEHGRYRATLLLEFVGTNVGFHFFKLLCTLLLFTGSPMLRSREKLEISQRWNRIQILFALAFFSVLIPALIYVQPSPLDFPETYNLAASFHAQLITLQSVVFFGSCLYYSRLILKKLRLALGTGKITGTVGSGTASSLSDGGSNAPPETIVANRHRLERNIVRILALQKMSLALLVSTVVFLQIFVMLFWMWRSVPLQIIFHSAAFFCNAAVFPLLSFFALLKGDQDSSQHISKLSIAKSMGGYPRPKSVYKPIQSSNIPDMAQPGTIMSSFNENSYWEDQDISQVTFEKAKAEGFRWRRWSNDLDKERAEFEREYSKWRKQRMAENSSEDNDHEDDDE